MFIDCVTPTPFMFRISPRATNGVLQQLLGWDVRTRQRADNDGHFGLTCQSEMPGNLHGASLRHLTYLSDVE